VSHTSLPHPCLVPIPTTSLCAQHPTACVGLEHPVGSISIGGWLTASLPLRLLITFVSDAEAFAWQGYLYSILLFLTAMLQSLCLQQYFNLCFQLGTNVRASLIAAIYKKVGMALSLSPAGFLLAGLGIPASLAHQPGANSTFDSYQNLRSSFSLPCWFPALLP